MSEQVRCTEELFSSYVHPLHGNPYTSHHIYHLAFSPMIVLIDVSRSHPFCLPPPYFSLCHPKCQLSCLRSSIMSEPSVRYVLGSKPHLHSSQKISKEII